MDAIHCEGYRTEKICLALTDKNGLEERANEVGQDESIQHTLTNDLLTECDDSYTGVSVWVPEPILKMLIEKQQEMWSNQDYAEKATAKEEVLMFDWMANEGCYVI